MVGENTSVYSLKKCLPGSPLCLPWQEWERGVWDVLCLDFARASHRATNDICGRLMVALKTSGPNLRNP